VYKDTTFVIYQYINQISKDKNLDVVYVESLADISADADSFFGTNEDVLYVFNTDKLECSPELLKYKNTIIVCKSVVGKESCAENTVMFDTLTREQILEYMGVLCPEITANNLEWLYDILSGNIYTIDIELKKLKYFSGRQDDMFTQVRAEGGYPHINSTTIFNFINAIINKKFDVLLETMSNLDVIDVEGTGLVTLLLRNIKNIIDIQTNPKATAESTKMSDKQFYAVKKSCGIFSTMQLANMFEFLTDVDYRLKSGQLELSNEQFVGYIFNNIVEIGHDGKVR
jgi:DNA-binding protein YbaB